MKELGSVDGIDMPSLFPVAVDLEAAEAPHVYGLVTRLLSRKETMSNPAALKAIKAEADGLVNVDTWDLSSVREKTEVVKEAKETGTHIHLGQLMSICSEKFAEMPPEQRVLKGRIAR